MAEDQDGHRGSARTNQSAGIGASWIACFTPGVLIATPTGEVPVETLQAGDQVLTRDNGNQVLRWIGRRDLSSEELEQQPLFQPIRIRAGAIGPNLPATDLVLSPQHRLLLTGASTALHFGDHEVLAAVRHMLGRPGFERLQVPSVSYLHLLFDQHEIVLSDGTWTESFQPGDWTLKGMGDAQRDEVLALYPELADHSRVESYLAARKVLKDWETRLFDR